MKRSLLILCAFVAVVISIPSCTKTKNSTVVSVVNVSGLFSLTGNWSTLGVNSQAALQLAAIDINNYLASKNAGFRMSVTIYDTKLDPTTAAQDFTTATHAGTHFIIGPQSSSELATIVPLADAAQAIVISQGSTAGSLAIAGDPVFRFCPPDKVEGAAIANTMYTSGIRGLVTIARNDAGNLGLQLSTDSFFVAKGGQVAVLPAYSTTLTEFTSQISSLKSQVATFTGLNNSQIGIYLASFDEGADLMAQASTDSQLSRVKWFGGDGIVLSAIMQANDSADKFAIRTGFFAPSYGLPVAQQSQWQPVANRIKSITGINADAFALAAYDAMWVIANTLEATGGVTSNFTNLKTVFVQQANAYTGLTGSTALDSYGDRASGSFDYWGIALTDTAYNWVVVGESE